MPDAATGGTRAGPLQGIRVVECASIVLGPMTAQYLGDMGADIIKVEPPEGDLTREIGPRRAEKMGALFLSNNRNKRSVVLDLKNPDDRDVLHQIVSRSDVLLHSIRSSSAERIGLGYNDLARHNGRLVYCHLEGFSEEGSYGGRPAYDDIVQSLSGLAMLQTVVTGQPRYVPSIIADKVTAVHAAYAIALALFHRDRTGRGQEVHVPMFETMVRFNMAEHLWGHVFEPPMGPMGYEPVATASRRPFPTLDGYLALIPYSDAQWHRFFELSGRSDIIADPRFATFRGRQQNVTLIWKEVADQVALRTTAAWTKLLENEDIPFAPVLSLEQLLADPHLEETGFWQTVADPVQGMLRFPGDPVTLSESPASLRRLPPRLGEHTDEVLAELGIVARPVGRREGTG